MSPALLALLVTIGLAVLVPAVLVWLATQIGPKRSVPSKAETYESGIQHLVGSARGRFSVKFYLVAILFVLFDVEVVFLFPWAVNFHELGNAGFLQMFVFVAILLVGYVYILARGALEWD